MTRPCWTPVQMVKGSEATQTRELNFSGGFHYRTGEGGSFCASHIMEFLLQYIKILWMKRKFTLGKLSISFLDGVLEGSGVEFFSLGAFGVLRQAKCS